MPTSLVRNLFFHYGRPPLFAHDLYLGWGRADTILLYSRRPAGTLPIVTAQTADLYIGGSRARMDDRSDAEAEDGGDVPGRRVARRLGTRSACDWRQCGDDQIEGDDCAASCAVWHASGAICMGAAAATGETVV